jgi:sulfur-oxidizing protein SoxX
MNTKSLVVAWSVAMFYGSVALAAPPGPQASADAGVVTVHPAAVEMDPAVILSNNNLGNCLACHAVPKHPELVAGNIGPPFVAMKERFPALAKLKAIIYDEQVNNPDTIMPPFGRNKVLTEEQINALARYIQQF